MALSNSFDFTVARSDIIPAALRKLGVLAEGQSPTTNQTTYASLALNVMLKAFQTDGLPLWYVKTGYIYPVSDINTVAMAGSGGGHWSGELILTKLTADSTSSDTTIDVSITAADDVVGTTANSDNVGIELDDGTMFWTTISSGGGTATLTIATGLTSAASTGARVYAYTAKQQQPEKILDVYRVNATTGARVPLLQTPASLILAQNQLTESTPTTWTYAETVNAVPGTNSGTFWFWPRWSNGDEYLEIRYQHPFDDMDADASNLAFPAAWYEAIIYGLALRLADEYQVPDNVYKRVGSGAQTAKDLAESATTEGSYIRVYPETE